MPRSYTPREGKIAQQRGLMIRKILLAPGGGRVSELVESHKAALASLNTNFLGLID
jgi:hypothetical protein